MGRLLLTFLGAMVAGFCIVVATKARSHGAGRGATYSAVIAREGGRSSIPEAGVGELALTTSAAAYWIARLRGR
ncbi:hypothetical protein CO669_29320 [Bradyrhizobium sp. Y36]|nr:hypothetical protein CO669_29320 [Bradyrhizobium sp. Y36]